MSAAGPAAGPEDACPDGFVELAGRLADAVRPIVLNYFRGEVAIEAKADRSPVTAADREAETAMRAMIVEAYPDHGILGEEHGSERLEAEYVWVLDPIDGTTAFVTGKPLFGTLIALTRRGRPILGVIDMPALDERWVGARGRATRFGDVPAKARPCADVEAAWLSATSPEMFADSEAVAFERLSAGVRRTVYGGDCYNYGLLASGHLDLVAEAGLKPYDFCALVPVIEGAGGTVSDWEGRPLSIDSEGRALAAGDERAHAEALARLAGDGVTNR
jgi:inositol-phosphate phosphatase/L-galactose 1-phosphate phosphatase/histidinol-phosphatase